MPVSVLSVVEMEHGPVAQEFAKKGCPITYRVDLWKQILGVQVDDIVSTLM